MHRTLQQIIEELPTDVQWAVQEWCFREQKNQIELEEGKRIAEAIQSPEGAICISDGSCKDTLRTACFTILGRDEQGSIVCPMVVPGSKEVQSAFISELSGPTVWL